MFAVEIVAGRIFRLQSTFAAKLLRRTVMEDPYWNISTREPLLEDP